MQKFKTYIKSIEINILRDLLKQYRWETECNLDNHSDKILLIENELKSRLTVKNINS